MPPRPVIVSSPGQAGICWYIGARLENMRINLKLSQQGMILVGVPLMFEISFAFILGFMCLQAQDEVKSVAWARKVEIEKSRLMKCAVELSAGNSNYLWTQDPRWLQLCRKGINELPARYYALEAL